MRRGVADLVLMLVSPVAALAVYVLLRPLNAVVAVVAGTVLMLALAVARRPAHGDDEAAWEPAAGP